MNLKHFLPDLSTIPSMSSSRSPNDLQLKSSESKFYGVEGCKFCDMQKKELGNQYKNVYVDCDDSKNNKVCKKLDGFPTWEINGKLYPGFMKKEELRDKLKK